MAEESAMIAPPPPKHHGLPIFDAHHPPSQELLSDCVHCGFCLVTCPTYRLWGEEADSPRGRIYLMQMGLNGEAALDGNYVGHFDRCLGCMACLTSCPSGVQYDKLIEATRAQIERRFVRSASDRLFRKLLFATFPHPGRLRLLALPLWVYQRSGLGSLAHRSGLLTRLPLRLRAMVNLVPTISLRACISGVKAPRRAAKARLRVGMLLGCVQRIFFDDVNQATMRVLAAEGCDVVIPKGQGCCGALMTHAGEEAMAADFARRTIDAFEDAEVDVIAINAAGCGSAMKEYAHLLRDDPKYAKRAKALAAKCRDISEILADLEPLASRQPLPMTVAYHDACHLQHAQGITSQPRRLLQSIPGLEIAEIEDPAICCGSAGIYNLLEPEAAAELGKMKAQNVLKTGARAVVSGNPGCTLQLRSSLESLGRPMPVLHWIQLLDASIHGTIPDGLACRDRANSAGAFLTPWERIAIIWTQAYTPFGNLLLSALVASLPVCVLLGLLAFTRVKAHFAALAALAASLIVAIAVYRMPWQLSGMAALDGMAYGAFPIGWIVVGAIFIYDITVHTGQFEIVKQSVAGLADDRRIQAILIAFCFGSFMEGAAGFGTPVAISAAMLIGLGFRPLPAAGLALIGNTAPVAFGAMGTPILALANVTGIAPEVLSAMIGKQLALFGLIIPFWLVCAMAGWRNMLEVWPACLTAGFTFAITQLIVSNYHGPWLVDIAASLVSILSVLLLLRYWQPKTIWRFDHEEQSAAVAAGGQGQAIGPPADPGAFVPTAAGRPTGRQMVVAWMPWVIVSVIVFTWGIPQVKNSLNKITQVTVAIPLLNKAVFRAPPVVRTPKAEDAVFAFNWLTATGTALLIAGIASGFMLGIAPLSLLRLFGKTLHRVRWSLLTISAMMAIGYTTRYGGLDATMGLAFASTGKLFPLFSPMLGWLGVALTGSDTASNVLFGNLQQITANKLGFSPVLAAAANSSGGVMGKMIDAQSIVVAGVATGQCGGEGLILRYVFFHSIALASLVGLLVMFQAYVH